MVEPLGILKSSSGLPFQKPEGRSRTQPPWEVALPSPGASSRAQGEVGRSRGPGKPLSASALLRRRGEDYDLRAYPLLQGKEEVEKGGHVGDGRRV